MSLELMYGELIAKDESAKKAAVALGIEHEDFNFEEPDAGKRWVLALSNGMPLKESDLEKVPLDCLFLAVDDRYGKEQHPKRDLMLSVLLRRMQDLGNLSISINQIVNIREFSYAPSASMRPIYEILCTHASIDAWNQYKEKMRKFEYKFDQKHDSYTSFISNVKTMRKKAKNRTGMKFTTPHGEIVAIPIKLKKEKKPRAPKSDPLVDAFFSGNPKRIQNFDLKKIAKERFDKISGNLSLCPYPNTRVFMLSFPSEWISPYRVSLLEDYAKCKCNVDGVERDVAKASFEEWENMSEESKFTFIKEGCLREPIPLDELEGFLITLRLQDKNPEGFPHVKKYLLFRKCLNYLGITGIKSDPRYRKVPDSQISKRVKVIMEHSDSAEALDVFLKEEKTEENRMVVFTIGFYLASDWRVSQIVYGYSKEY